MKAQLLEAATLRTAKVAVEGVEVEVREVSTLEMAKYGTMQETDRRAATAGLIRACVVPPEGEEPMTLDEALVLADRARIALPIVNRVLKLSGFKADAGEDVEKHSHAD